MARIRPVESRESFRVGRTTPLSRAEQTAITPFGQAEGTALGGAIQDLGDEATRIASLQQQYEKIDERRRKDIDKGGRRGHFLDTRAQQLGESDANPQANALESSDESFEEDLKQHLEGFEGDDLREEKIWTGDVRRKERPHYAQNQAVARKTDLLILAQDLELRAHRTLDAQPNAETLEAIQANYADSIMNAIGNGMLEKDKISMIIAFKNRTAEQLADRLLESPNTGGPTEVLRLLDPKDTDPAFDELTLDQKRVLRERARDIQAHKQTEDLSLSLDSVKADVASRMQRKLRTTNYNDEAFRSAAVNAGWEADKIERHSANNQNRIMLADAWIDLLASLKNAATPAEKNEVREEALGLAPQGEGGPSSALFPEFKGDSSEQDLMKSEYSKMVETAVRQDITQQTKEPYNYNLDRPDVAEAAREFEESGALADRHEFVRRQASWQRSSGLPEYAFEVMPPSEAQQTLSLFQNLPATDKAGTPAVDSVMELLTDINAKFGPHAYQAVRQISRVSADASGISGEFKAASMLKNRPDTLQMLMGGLRKPESDVKKLIKPEVFKDIDTGAPSDEGFLAFLASTKGDPSRDTHGLRTGMVRSFRALAFELAENGQKEPLEMASKALFGTDKNSVGTTKFPVVGATTVEIPAQMTAADGDSINLTPDEQENVGTNLSAFIENTAQTLENAKPADIDIDPVSVFEVSEEELQAMGTDTESLSFNLGESIFRGFPIMEKGIDPAILGQFMAKTIRTRAFWDIRSDSRGYDLMILGDIGLKSFIRTKDGEKIFIPIEELIGGQGIESVDLDLILRTAEPARGSMK